MIIVFTLIGAVVGWFILMLISTNLIGFFIRGIYKPVNFDEFKKSEYKTIRDEAKKLNRANIFGNIFGVILIIVYLFLLYYFLNLGIMFTGLILMITRIPDLLWEIRNGKKINKYDKPKGSLYQSMTILSWIALIILWISLYWKYTT